jgi:hypothetical protein
MAFPAQGQRQERKGDSIPTRHGAKLGKGGIAEALAADVKGFVSREAN